MRALVRFVPAAIAVLALGAVLLRVDLDEVRTAMVQGHVAAIVPWAALLAIGYMALHANWERVLLSRTPVPPRYWSVWAGKAGTAVLNAIGFALGSGGYVVWIGIVADLAALALVTLVAILVGDATVPTVFTVGVVGAFGAAAIVAGASSSARSPQRCVRRAGPARSALLLRS